MNDPRLEVEALLKCPQCAGVPYKLWRRETKADSGIFEHVIWPTDPALPPPKDTSALICEADGATLARVAP